MADLGHMRSNNWMKQASPSATAWQLQNTADRSAFQQQILPFNSSGPDHVYWQRAKSQACWLRSWMQTNTFDSAATAAEAERSCHTAAGHETVQRSQVQLISEPSREERRRHWCRTAAATSVTKQGWLINLQGVSLSLHKFETRFLAETRQKFSRD